MNVLNSFVKQIGLKGQTIIVLLFSLLICFGFYISPNLSRFFSIVVIIVATILFLIMLSEEANQPKKYHYGDEWSKALPKASSLPSSKKK